MQDQEDLSRKTCAARAFVVNYETEARLAPTRMSPTLCNLMLTSGWHPCFTAFGEF